MTMEFLKDPPDVEIKLKCARHLLPRPQLPVYSPIFFPMWQNFTMSGHNDDKIIGSDSPYPEYQAAVQTLRRGASVLPSQKGHCFINPRKPVPSIFNIMTPGKPQMCPLQIG